LPVPKLSHPSSVHIPSNVDNETVARVMQKLSNNNASFPSPIPNTSSRLVFRPTSSAHNGHEKDNGNSSTPLIVLSKAEDIGTSSLNKSESLKPKITHQSDVIMLDNEKYYAPDSVSPSPKPGFSRFFLNGLLLIKRISLLHHLN